MPATRKVNRRPRPKGKRRVKRSQRKGNKVTSSFSSSLTVPDRYYTKLKFSGRFEQTVAAGVTLTENFRGNGPRDPLVAAGGTSANGWARLAALYDRYRCFGSTIKVMAFAPSSSSPIECVIHGSPNLTGYTTPLPYEIKELPNTKFWFTQDGLALPTSQRTMYLSTAKAAGRSHQEVKVDDAFQTVTTADPPDQWYWRFSAKNALTASPTTLNYYVEVTYYVEFFERNSDTVS